MYSGTISLEKGEGMERGDSLKTTLPRSQTKREGEGSIAALLFFFFISFLEFIF